jgi:mevalonate kinase
MHNQEKAMWVTASAPGKLLLLGDHAVVYNHPCLVTAVDIRYDVSVTRQDSAVIEIETPALKQANEVYRVSVHDAGAHYQADTAFVEAAVVQMQQLYGGKPGLKIATSGPARSFGLGSSSAVTVATLAALDRLFNLRLSRRELFSAGYQAVLDVQGLGSGFDVAAAVYGGTLYYVTGGAELEQLAVADLPFVVGYSGAKVGTINLVKSVAERRRQYPEMVDSLFGIAHEIVETGKLYLLQRDWTAFGALMDVHQGLLEALGVSTGRLAALIYAARDAGASGAKLSGAGGGDCMFAAVTDDSRAAVAQAIEAAGGELVTLPLGAEGVRVL